MVTNGDRSFYFVCATPRSGSTLLCEALRISGGGKPGEFFDTLHPTGLSRSPMGYFEGMEAWKQAKIQPLLAHVPHLVDARQALLNSIPYEMYLEGVIEENTVGGMFGAKLMWGYLHDFAAFLQTTSRYKHLPLPILLEEVFSKPRYILITRSDKVRQAISLWTALQTQQFQKDDQTQGLPSIDPVFSFEAIEHLLQKLREQEAAWEHYFASSMIEPNRILTIVYENMQENYLETVRQVLQFLGLPMPDASVFQTQRRMRQQSNTITEQWVREYNLIAEG